MKKIAFLLVICLTFSSLLFSQQQAKPYSDMFRPEFRIAVGVNAIQNLGTRKPFTDFDEWSFGLPLSAALEYKFSHNWAIEQAFNVNKFDTESNIDGGITSEEHTYLGTNTNLKWYPNWLKSEKFKLFANAGIGVFKIDDLNTTANLGGGMLYWFSDSFGVRGTALGKFAIDNKDRIYDTNHFQYMLEVVFKI